MPSSFKGSITKAQKAFIGGGGISRYGSAKGEFEAFDLNGVGDVMARWGEELIQMAQENLRKQDLVASGDLSDSFKYVLTKNMPKYTLEIKMADYFDFVNKGVKGSDPRAPQKNTTSPYQFTGKYRSVNVEAIKKWVIRNNLQYRQDTPYRVAQNVYGRKRLDVPITPEQQLQNTAFRIARGIYRSGLKYSGYWDDALKELGPVLGPRISEAAGKETAVTFTSVFPKLITI
jgi:hypothetical protein